MKFYIYGIASILFMITTLSCSPSTTIEGHVEGVNIDLPRNVEVDLVFYNPLNSETLQMTTRVRMNGNFKAKVKEENIYLVYAEASPSYVDASMPRQSASADWLMTEPVYLKVGGKIRLGDLYYSTRFELSMAEEMSQISSVDELVFSWDPINFADYYVVYINEKIEGKKLVTLYATKEVMYSSTSRGPLITFDTKMTAEEIDRSAPIFRIKERLERGEYQILVGAVKKVGNGKSITIASSKEVPFTIR